MNRSGAGTGGFGVSRMETGTACPGLTSEAGGVEGNKIRCKVKGSDIGISVWTPSRRTTTNVCLGSTEVVLGTNELVPVSGIGTGIGAGAGAGAGANSRGGTVEGKHVEITGFGLYVVCI